MYQISFCVILMIELMTHHGSITAVSGGDYEHLTYRLMTSDLLSTNSYGLASVQWTGVSDISACALKSFASCSGSRGFVYSPSSKTCIPLLWLQVGSGGGTTLHNVDPQQWMLFVSGGLCQNGFNAFDSSEEGHYTCLRRLTSSSTYSKATSQCNGLGGFLASVKTVAELNIIISLSQSRDHWVGMDDQAQEGVHVWQEDGQRLTSQQQQDVFQPGEPNNYGGYEDCAYYRDSHRALNDHHCWATKLSFCESEPLSGSC